MNSSAPGTVDVERIVDFPWEVLEYLTWLRQQPSSRGLTGAYLFDTPRVRFAVAESDLVVAAPDISVAAGADGLRLVTPPATVAIDALSERERPLVETLLCRLDGQCPLALVRAGLEPGDGRVLDALLEAAFGKLLFAPLAVMTLERAISGIEVTRFPGSPYEIGRPYWKNMAAVRAASDRLFQALEDEEAFARELRKLHVTLLMGADLQSYYQPASPISSGRAAPGRFMVTAAEVVERADEAAAAFVSGPRVAAAAVGGIRYQELLCRSLGEPEAAHPRRFVDEGGLDWGRWVNARAATDATTGPWFCPPRPLCREHFRTLCASLAAAEQAARSGEVGACLRALAGFHQNFVRLHPFHCGNQSLAMNLTNRVANRLARAGMPHLMLDHLAFRLSPQAYARVFRRAWDAYVQPAPNAAARYSTMGSNRTRTFELMRQIDAASTLNEAEALTRADAAGAELLLLTDR